jgi:hypothetical protein
MLGKAQQHLRSMLATRVAAQQFEPIDCSLPHPIGSSNVGPHPLQQRRERRPVREQRLLEDERHDRCGRYPFTFRTTPAPKLTLRTYPTYRRKFAKLNQLKPYATIFVASHNHRCASKRPWTGVYCDTFGRACQDLKSSFEWLTNLVDLGLGRPIIWFSARFETISSAPAAGRTA